MTGSPVKLALCAYMTHRRACAACRAADEAADGVGDGGCEAGITLLEAFEAALRRSPPKPVLWLGKCQGVPCPTKEDRT